MRAVIVDVVVVDIIIEVVVFEEGKDKFVHGAAYEGALASDGGSRISRRVAHGGAVQLQRKQDAVHKAPSSRSGTPHCNKKCSQGQEKVHDLTVFSRSLYCG